MAYTASFRDSAIKQLEKLPQSIARRVIQKTAGMAQNPRPSGCLKSSGADNLWRVRVGDCRIIYVIDDAARSLDVRIVAHRREVYRGL